MSRRFTVATAACLLHSGPLAEVASAKRVEKFTDPASTAEVTPADANEVVLSSCRGDKRPVVKQEERRIVDVTAKRAEFWLQFGKYGGDVQGGPNITAVALTVD
jgi:hypothetical protein